MGAICRKRAMKASHSRRRENRKQPAQSNMLMPVIHAKSRMPPATLSEEQDSDGSARSIRMDNTAKTMASKMLTAKKIFLAKGGMMEDIPATCIVAGLSR
jgi:hypothetical protein